MKKLLKQVRGQKQVREWKQVKDGVKGSLYVDNSKEFAIPILTRSRPIMLKILPIMLLSTAQKISPLCSILCS